MIRRLAAVVLAAHGVAHVVGFVAAFQLGDFAARTVETSLLWGRLDVSTTVIQVMGIGWLFLAIGFMAVAVALWRSMRHAISGLALATMVSLGFTVLASPTAIVGLGLNIVIVVGLIAYELRLRPAAERGRPPTLMSGPTSQIR